jgi:hypothetical protein
MRKSSDAAAGKARFAVIALLALAPPSALSAELLIETDAKKNVLEENWSCTAVFTNGDDGGFHHLDQRCADEPEWTAFLWEDLIRPEGVVTLRQDSHDVIWIRLDAEFDRHKDGWSTVTFLRNGINGSKGQIRLHAYKLEEEWVYKFEDPKNGEVEVTKLCAKRKQVLGKTVGIDRIYPAHPGGECGF